MANTRTTRKVPTDEPVSKSRVGVWIDTSEAVIIAPGDGSAEVREVASDMDQYERIIKEKKTGSRFGQGFINKEGKEQAKLDKVRSEYLRSVIKELGSADELVVFGPAQLKHELAQELGKTPNWKKAPITVKTADSMTRNQKVAWVKKFFTV